MTALPKRRIASTEVEVSVLGLGGAPLGNLFEVIPEERALATVGAAHAAGYGWFDTAPFYGHGVSEHRFGHVLHPRVAAVAAGAVTPDQAADNAAMMTRAIPDAFWEALRAARLIGPDVATPKSGPGSADR